MKLIIVALALIIVGCSVNPAYRSPDSQGRRPPRRYTSRDTEPRVESKGRITYMVASYYGSKFHGRVTANGEIFDMYKFTCAHKELPFNTMLRVTNEDNGKSVTVRVNDRGPFISGRDLDLSYAAAAKIGLIAEGVKKVKVEILGVRE